MKTARFTTIVQSAGSPTVHPLWLDPGQDKALQKALKEQRVLTVHQDVRGTRKDFGTVGLVQEPEAQFLVFPKSLRRFAGQRVVGIDYELLARDPPSTATRAVQPKPAKQVHAGPTKRIAFKPPRKTAAARREPEAPSPPPSAASIIPFESKVEATVLKPDAIQKTKAKAKKPLPSKATDATSPGVGRSELLPQLRRIRSDLKNGKAVAAYERLERLLRRLEG
jgi:hypothetical protein